MISEQRPKGNIFERLDFKGELNKWKYPERGGAWQAKRKAKGPA